MLGVRSSSAVVSTVQTRNTDTELPATGGMQAEWRGDRGSSISLATGLPIFYLPRPDTGHPLKAQKADSA